MKFLPISVTVFYNQKNIDIEEECSLDPISEEEKSAECSLVFTLNPMEACSFWNEKNNNLNLIQNNNSDKNDDNNSGNNNSNSNNDENNNEKYGIICMLGTGSYSLLQLEIGLKLAKSSTFILQQFIRRIVSDKLKLNI